jgi:hypothetical protein
MKLISDFKLVNMSFLSFMDKAKLFILNTMTIDNKLKMMHISCRVLNIFQVYQYFTIYRWYFFIKI